MGHFDLQATIMAAVGGDATVYGPTMFEVDREGVSRTRPYYATTNDGWHDQEIVEYEIAGDPLNTDNWQATGSKWAAQE